MHTQLFQGNLIRLTALDAARDAETESRWTHDAEFMRALSAEPLRPLAPNIVRQKRETAQKDLKPQHLQFAIRPRAEERLLGVAQLARLDWTNGSAWLTLGIADACERGKGYGGEALRLLVNYAFAELNLQRLVAVTADDNPRAIRFFERAGFVSEVRRRQAIHRDGKRWDAVMLGILREEWSAG